jgi:spore coat protein U-like protein
MPMHSPVVKHMSVARVHVGATLGAPHLGARMRACLAIALALFGRAALAAPTCTIDEPTEMVFTGYTPFGPGVAATATIRYRCPKPVGNVWIGIAAPRVMTAGGDSLPFELYQSPYPGALWGDQPPVAVPPTTKGSVTVYGFLPPQDAAAGDYRGTFLVTIYTDTPQAASDTATLVTSTAGFVDTCIIGAGTLAFGSYDPVGAHAASPLDAQATFQIACTRATRDAVGLGAGSFPSGATRQMANGAGRLRYELYTDPGRTTVWNDTSTVAGTAASTAPVPLVVHGRVPGGQAAPAGAYADTVISTIDF